MARAIAIRLSRPSTALLLLCCCLALMVGRQAIVSAGTGGSGGLSALVASILPPAPDSGLVRSTSTRAPQAAAPRPQAETTVTFQQGVSGYTGALDTLLSTGAPTANNSTAVTLVIDAAPSTQQALLRFDGIIGAGAGRIPVGSTITEATLRVRVSNASVPGATLHRMLQPWNATDNWNTFAGGIQADGIEAVAAADAAPANVVTGALVIDVTASLEAWIAGAANRGWAWLPPVVDDSLQFDSSDATTAANRPLLTVTFTPPATVCTTPADCSDGNPCTDDLCDLGTSTCSNPANTAACDDGNPCTDDICADGACVGTADNTNSCSDGAACTNDSCSGGTCVGVSACGCGTACNTGSGQCEAPAGLPVAVGQNWRYFKGTTNPPAAWRDLCFDDSNWFSGPGGFGYGGDCLAQRGTDLGGDMAGGYQSIYTRHVFNVPSAAGVTGLNLFVDYDDGFVAYLNGTEIARSQTMVGLGTPPPFNAASSGHECSVCDAGCGAVEAFSVNPALLIDGPNVLAIQGHNSTLTSGDYTLIARLEATDPPPSAPTSPSPANGATGIPVNPDLCVNVTDPSGDAMNVTFKGRPAGGSAGEDFTVIVLPDTQYYSQSYPQIYAAQTQSIADNRVSRNIVFVTELGDCVNNGDQAGEEFQWTTASAAWDTIESAPGLPEGIPYGIAVGNHDNGGIARSGSDEGATTLQYTRNFGLQRFCPGTCSNNVLQVCEKDADCGGAVCNPGATCKSYFGGRYDFGDPTTYFRNTDNHYELFSAGGMDFIIFHLEWDCADGSMGCQSAGVAHPMRQTVINWMDNILTNVYPNRRAIVSSHFLLQPTGNPPAFSHQGQAVYNALQDNPNYFMALNGHLDQANRRRDEPQPGHVIHSMVTDYQTRPNGGDGWLRILTFHPQTNTITAETYSPYLGQFIYTHPDNTAGTAQQQFTLDYAMDAGEPFAVVGSQTSVASGSQVCVPWTGRQANTTYEWYVELSDGSSTTVGPRWTFTTHCESTAECDDGSVCTVDACDAGTCTHSAIGGCCVTAVDCNDAQACTDDTCVGNVCEHSNNTGGCSDGNACTAPDTCTGGACQPGAALVCDDANACTSDACAPATGCVYSYAPSAGCCTTHADCDDGIAGTLDTCTGGDCSNTPSASCNTTADCNDGNACTTDSCAAGNNAAVSFPGAINNRIEFPIGAGIDYLNDFGTGSFTIEGWVYTDGGAGDNTGIFRAGRQQAFPQVAIQLKGTAPFLQIAGSVETNTTGTQVDVLGPALTPNTWNHVALVVDRTAGNQQLRILVNGGAPTTAAAGAWSTNPISWTTDATVLGSARLDTGVLTLPFDGRLDEFRIWSVARTQAEIAADMSLAVASAPNLVHRWGMDEGTGTGVADSVGTAHGTMSGSSWVTTAAQLPSIGPGTCSHDVVPACVPCTSAAQCGDADACTNDSCVAGICQHAAGNCDDENACTTDTCDSETGACGHAPAPVGTACDSGDPCTTGGTCDADGFCVAGTAQSCDDGNACTTDLCSGTAAQNALAFANPTGTPAGSVQHVAFGAAGTHAELGLSQFTLEAWVYWNGGGVTASSGVNGIVDYPIVSKGRGEGDDSNVDCNYQFGIRSDNNRLAADFESFEPTVAGNNNYPVSGNTVVTAGAWHHVAATYDGACWQLYLDGVADTAGTTCPAKTPRFDSIQRFAIATALNSTGALEGGFNGSIDEVRVWNYARGAGDIAAAKDLRILTAPGLVGRWGLDTGAGNIATDTSGNANDGTLVNGPTWVAGATALPAVQCSSSGLPNGTSCADSDLCDGAETCQAGHCAAGTALVCGDANPCTDDTCSPATGCAHANNTGPCTDGSACTAGDVCAGGICVGGAPQNCDDGVACTADSCDSVNGCQHVDACTGGQICNHVTGLCQNFCLTNEECSDGAFCNGAETCQAGVCLPGTAPDCNDGIACTTDSCDENADACVHATSDAACSDGLFCNGAEICSAASGCIAGAAPNCDDGISCTADTCDEAGDTCTHIASNAACSDGLFCNGAEICSLVNGCQAGAAPNCSDGVVCTIDACDEAGDTCTHTASHAACDDANACNGVETCNVVTGCLAGTALNCDDGNACTTDLCDAGLGCVHPANPATCGDTDACSTDACTFAPSMSALALDGTNDYITMGTGPSPGLAASRFTLETWFNWTGGGTTMPSGTGTGGLPNTTIPLFSNGAPEADTPANLNMNYFLGISNNRLSGDFEDAATGLNHPICTAASAPAITLNAWHHAAATYDGTRWRLYLDGVELPVDTACSNCSGGACTVSPGATPETGTIQRFGVGSALTSTGANVGGFQGRMDEVRVWNYARSQSEISFGRDRRITSDLGLLGRWGFDEGAGTTAGDSTTPAENGTLTNFNSTPDSDWVASAPVFSTAACSYPNAPDGTSCSDSNICTSSDQCTTGVCGGAVVAGCCLTAADCNDGLVCTTDACVANACQNTPVPGCASCSTNAQCDDGNSCTTESCDTANDAAISFAGTAGNRVQFPIGAGVDYLNDFGTGSFTIEVWVYTDGGAAALTGLFRAGRQQAFPQVVLQLTGTGNLQIAGSVETNTTSPTTQVDVTGPAIPVNTWTHVAMVVDRTPGSQQLRIIVNGGTPTSTTANLWGTNAISWTTDATILGAARDSGGAVILPFDGRLDEWRIWSVARTQAQIAADMNREIFSAPNLVHRWGMNEAAGTTTADSVGGATGTLTTATAPAPSWSTTNLRVFGDDLCDYINVADGTTCSDNSLCTSGDTCQSGVCGGVSTVTCTALDQCHVAGACNPLTGQCSNPNAADGTLCDDGNACSTGTTCTAGACGGGLTPPDNDCDGVDDDCNGTADDGYIPVATTCGVGACASTGLSTCAGGTIGSTCTPGPTTGDDTDCDAIDDDCDGSTDEGYAPIPTTCGVGACGSTGLSTCTGGTIGSTCTPGPTTGDDTDCDAIDDDCDGTADEGYAPIPTTCGIGACGSTGQSTCAGGIIGSTCTPGPTTGDDTDCDGIDDDCDGTTDEDHGLPSEVMDLTVSPIAPESSVAQLDWSAVPLGSAYHLYRAGRGDFSDLACFLPDLTTPGTTDDGAIPPLGEGLFYLVTAVYCGDESTLGRASNGVERIIVSPCP